MKPKIFPAARCDLPRLSALEQELFSYDLISRRQFGYLMTKANGSIVKAEYDGELVGYMVLLRRKMSRKLRIYSLGVVESARKRGIARSLLAYAEFSALRFNLDHLTLEVCEHNDCAMRLYYYAGFRIYGRKNEYYENGCSALLLRKSLLPEEAVQ